MGTCHLFYQSRYKLINNNTMKIISNKKICLYIEKFKRIYCPLIEFNYETIFKKYIWFDLYIANVRLHGVFRIIN